MQPISSLVWFQENLRGFSATWSTPIWSTTHFVYHHSMPETSPTLNDTKFLN